MAHPLREGLRASPEEVSVGVEDCYGNPFALVELREQASRRG